MRAQRALPTDESAVRLRSRASVAGAAEASRQAGHAIHACRDALRGDAVVFHRSIRGLRDLVGISKDAHGCGLPRRRMPAPCRDHAAVVSRPPALRTRPEGDDDKREEDENCCGDQRCRHLAIMPLLHSVRGAPRLDATKAGTRERGCRPSSVEVGSRTSLGTSWPSPRPARRRCPTCGARLHGAARQRSSDRRPSGRR